MQKPLRSDRGAGPSLPPSPPDPPLSSCPTCNQGDVGSIPARDNMFFSFLWDVQLNIICAFIFICGEIFLASKIFFIDIKFSLEIKLWGIVKRNAVLIIIQGWRNMLHEFIKIALNPMELNFSSAWQYCHGPNMSTNLHARGAQQ